MNKEERNAKIELYGRGYGLLSAALAQIPREVWEFKPSPMGWSVHEILVHMGDSESMAALRVRKLIAEPGSLLMGYDEASWASALDYQHHDVECSLDIIRLARQTTYDLIKRQPDEIFVHSVWHPEIEGPYTFDTWLDIYSRHIPDHIQQMQEALQAWQSSQPR
ncbi:MAG TPA: DinB family protein [Anaerolineales bacterium]|nr:DinB family protein [Anaerolineales bacterium]